MTDEVNSGDHPEETAALKNLLRVLGPVNPAARHTERFGEHVSAVVEIGKNHIAEITMEAEAYNLVITNNWGSEAQTPREGKMQDFRDFQKRVHQTAVSKGWWEDDPRTAKGRVLMDCTKIALMHSELSEALENMREGEPPDDKIPDFSGVEAELADTIIRICDLAERRGYRVADALLAKAAYNETRTKKHGGKKV